MTAQPDAGPPDQRLGEVLAAYLEAVDAGWAPDRDAFLDRYPELAPQLAAFFHDQDQVAQLVHTLPLTPSPLASGERATGVGRGHTPPGDRPAPGEAPTLPYADAPPATDLNLDQFRFFGDYEIVEEIARGGMGVVYKARQRGLNRFVALKMILAGRFASRAEVQRFQREAEHASQLDHPNIVPIFTVGEQHGQHYFTMKLIEGGNLSLHMPRLAQDLKAAVRILVAVAHAVHYAHQHGILHRDLKPANILLDSHGQPHVTDFGLAKRLPAGADPTPSGDGGAGYVAPEQVAHQDGMWTTIDGGPSQAATLSAIAGTPAYMPPEQAAAVKGGLTTAADVYGLGAVLYKVLTGQPPFRGATWQETLERVREDEPTPPRTLKPGVPRDLEAVCLKCLRKNPADRYESAQALADDMGRWLAGEPVLARQRPWPARVWRTVRRHAILSLLVAALAFAVGTAYGFFYLSDPDRPLHAIEKKLERGESVTLVGEKGMPIWHRGKLFESSVLLTGGDDKPFSLSTLKFTELELLPSPHAAHFRYSAEVRHDGAVPSMGQPEVGIFFGLNEWGKGFAWCELTFADQGFSPPNLFQPAPPPPQSFVHLTIRSVTSPGLESACDIPHPAIHEPFTPDSAVQGSERHWRRLAVEVSPESVVVFWEGKRLAEIPWQELQFPEKLVPPGTPVPEPPLTLGPGGGIGLYLSQGEASYRNVALEPLK
jgi:serine/threonine protein kinase